jgi:acetoacetyl-CoA synthetase
MSTTPTPEAVWTHPFQSTTPLESFRRQVNSTYSLNLQSYKELHDWSVTDLEHFAAAVWAFCGIVYSVPPTCSARGLDKMWPPPAWFPGARLNYTENILSFGLASRPDAIAITAVKEGLDEVEHLTFRQLEQHVAVWALALRRLGVGVGDRVACKPVASFK